MVIRRLWAISSKLERTAYHEAGHAVGSEVMLAEIIARKEIKMEYKEMHDVVRVTEAILSAK